MKWEFAWTGPAMMKCTGNVAVCNWVRCSTKEAHCSYCYESLLYHEVTPSVVVPSMIVMHSEVEKVPSVSRCKVGTSEGVRRRWRRLPPPDPIGNTPSFRNCYVVALSLFVVSMCRKWRRNMVCRKVDGLCQSGLRSVTSLTRVATISPYKVPLIGNAWCPRQGVVPPTPCAPPLRYVTNPVEPSYPRSTSSPKPRKWEYPGGRNRGCTRRNHELRSRWRWTRALDLRFSGHRRYDRRLDVYRFVGPPRTHPWLWTL